MPQRTSGPKRPRTPPVPSRRQTPLLRADDVCAYLLEHAAQIAPADVDALIAESEEIRRKAAQDNRRHARFHHQIDVALQLLADHASGEAPQIPYHTVSLLAAAMFYWLEPMDAIPDFIPGAGTSDDALVLELACELGAAGLERYCTFKDIACDGLFVPAKTTTRPAPQRPRS